MAKDDLATSKDLNCLSVAHVLGKSWHVCSRAPNLLKNFMIFKNKKWFLYETILKNNCLLFGKKNAF